MKLGVYEDEEYGDPHRFYATPKNDVLNKKMDIQDQVIHIIAVI